MRILFFSFLLSFFLSNFFLFLLSSIDFFTFKLWKTFFVSFIKFESKISSNHFSKFFFSFFYNERLSMICILFSFSSKFLFESLLITTFFLFINNNTYLSFSYNILYFFRRFFNKNIKDFFSYSIDWAIFVFKFFLRFRSILFFWELFFLFFIS